MNVLVDMYMQSTLAYMGGRVVHIERGFRLFFYQLQGLRSPQLA